MADYPLKSGQCALLIYDMTKELLDESSPGYSPWAVAEMPTFRRLIEACHRAGAPIFYALPQIRVDEADGDSALDAVCGPIRPTAEDTVIVRKKSGALADSPLEHLLRERGRTTLLITGMAVDRGCNTGARDAYNLGLRPVMVRELCLTRDIQSKTFGFISKEEIQKVHLAALERAVARVATVAEIIGALSVKGA
jgi:bifunctional isochorismate lyase/aryl carrier protein